MRDLGKFDCRHWRDHHAAGIGDVERICAEMAGAIARRHSDRARTFCVLFSHRHLHHPEHSLESAVVDLQALGGSASPKTMAKNSPKAQYSSIMAKVKSAAITRPTCRSAAWLPSLSAHEIHAGLRRRNRE